MSDKRRSNQNHIISLKVMPLYTNIPTEFEIECIYKKWSIIKDFTSFFINTLKDIFTYYLPTYLPINVRILLRTVKNVLKILYHKVI